MNEPVVIGSNGRMFAGRRLKDGAIGAHRWVRLGQMFEYVPQVRDGKAQNRNVGLYELRKEGRPLAFLTSADEAEFPCDTICFISEAEFTAVRATFLAHREAVLHAEKGFVLDLPTPDETAAIAGNGQVQ